MKNISIYTNSINKRNKNLSSYSYIIFADKERMKSLSKKLRNHSSQYLNLKAMVEALHSLEYISQQEKFCINIWTNKSLISKIPEKRRKEIDKYEGIKYSYIWRSFFKLVDKYNPNFYNINDAPAEKEFTEILCREEMQ